MRYLTFILLLYFIPNIQLFGQTSNIGVPLVQNYNKQTYLGGTKNWGFVQDTLGVIYTSNNEGLLQFNGQDWVLYPLPNKTIVRGIAIDKAQRIYVGGQDEIGYFSPNQQGVLTFYSLKESIPPEHRHFEDVWQIVLSEEGVFFRTSTKIYLLSSSNISVFEYPYVFNLGKYKGKVICHVAEKGILEFNGSGFQTLFSTPILDQIRTSSFLPYQNDTLLLSTLRSGIYYYIDGKIGPWEIDNQNFIQNSEIKSSLLLKEGLLAFGTNLGGLIILNAKRKAIQVLNKREGLQNNSVNAIFQDQRGDLWLGLDNGIDQVLQSAPFSILYPNKALESASYTVKIHDGYIYVGTAEGLYFSPWKKRYNPLSRENNFQFVENTGGEVRSLDIIDEQLFMGHNDGAFIIEQNKASKISPSIGTWTFLQLKDISDKIIAGTYYGLSLFQKSPQGWEYAFPFKGLEESCRILSQSKDGNIWVSHPYRGVYQVQFDPASNQIEVSLPKNIKGLDTTLDNYINQFYGKAIVGTADGIYEFKTDQNQFVPFDQLNEVIGISSKLRGLFSAPNGDVWFITNEEVGLLKIEDEGLEKNIEKLSFPELKDKLVAGFEYIYPYDEENVFFGAEKGVLHFNPNKINLSKNNFKTIISQVYSTVEGDSLLYGGTGPIMEDNLFSNRFNAFRFHYAGLTFQNWNQLEYSTFLEGLDQEWSSWNPQRQKNYTNLSAGQYTFKVKARNAKGEISEIASYAFNIALPWYTSTPALLLYLTLLIGFILGAILIPRRQIRKATAALKSEQTRMKKEHAEEREASEKQIIQLKNEKLQADLDYQNQELATMTIHLVQKNGLLQKMAKELRQISKQTEKDPVKRKMISLARILENDANLEEDWKQFAFRFDQVHGDFFQRLKAKYPALTPKDHRLCAFLRLNLSTKEIAPLMNISVRGVEISRYRLRKKLKLNSEANLTDFLMSF